MITKRYPLRTRLKAASAFLRAAGASLVEYIPVEDALAPLTPMLLEPATSNGYERELSIAMVNPQVRNIAITGGYGAGKSSLILTFKEHHPQFTYAAISLATFRKDGEIVSTADEPAEAGPNEPAPDKPKVVELIARLEEAIVQQLLYAVPASKLPRSRLKRIVQASRGRAVLTTLLLLVGGLSVLRLILPLDPAPAALQPAWLSPTLLALPAGGALVAAIGVLACLIYAVARSLSLINIDGWSLKGGKIETVHHGSVLHKNVDEILYCFQNSTIDVVIIEDLDRFGVQDIFFRLREINAILNESPQIKRTVRFIYALNDELFAGGEKTKFFDLVVPIVPVINTENSHAKMVEMLRKRPFGAQTYADQLDPELVETVCYRIDDMRLVKNIVNEFHLFARILMTEVRLNWDKLFAIIVLKNLHSDHYWGLNKRQGFVYELIAGYTEWRGEQAAVVRAEMADLEQLLKDKQADVARSKHELRMLAWYYLQGRSTGPAATHIRKDNTGHSMAEFLDDEVFDDFATSRSAQVLAVVNNGVISQPFRLSEILEEMDYTARLAAISADDDHVHADLAAKAIYIDDLQKMPLKEAMRTGYQTRYSQQLAEHGTIKYLLTAGHLDQDYPDYLGHFYGHTIGREDMNLLLALRQGDTCEVGTPIEEPVKLLRKLRLEHIDQGRGIMADLVGYLCKPYPPTASSPYASYRQKVFNDADAHIDRFAIAVRMLVDRGQGVDLVRAIVALKPTLIGKVLAAGGVADNAWKPAFVVAILDALSESELATLEDSASIQHGIEALTDVTLLVDKLGSTDGAWPWMAAAGIRFGYLSTGTRPAVLASLIAVDALAPAFEMLQLVASNGEAHKEASVTVTVRRLRASGIDGVDRFLTAHGEAIGRALLGQTGELDETTESLLFALKVMERDEDLTVDYFEQTTCIFADLDQLPPMVWEAAMQSDRVEDRVAAMRLYERLHDEEDDAKDSDAADRRSVLAAYAEAHVDEVYGDLWDGDAAPERMQRWVLAEANLPDNVAVRLLSMTVMDDPDLLTEEVSDVRIQRLAALKCLALSADLWAVIAERSVDAQVAYLSPWWNQVRNSAIESSIPFATASVLYEHGVMPVADALRVFARFDDAAFTEAPTAVGLLARLAGQANAEHVFFPTSLSRVSALLMSFSHVVETLDQTALRHLLSQSIPEMTWAVIAALLEGLGSGWETLRPQRRFVVALKPGAELILLALQRRDFLSSLDVGENEATGRMRRNVA